MICCSFLSLWLSCNTLHNIYPRVSVRTVRIAASPSPLETTDSKSQDAIFGAEFRNDAGKPAPYIDESEQLYWKGRAYVKKSINSEKKIKTIQSFNNLRLSFISDSIFICLLGLSATWFLGSYRDALSYGLGSLLGLGYAVLLGRYVETIGGGQRGFSAGGLRFVPVILLVLFYAKNKESISIIPEIIGFCSYQVGSFLQIFNENAYGESTESNS